MEERDYEMILHSDIKEAVANALADDTEIRDYCIGVWGRGALVIVDAYGAAGTPSEEESPYIFLYSSGESSTGEVDEETFTMSVEVGGAFDTLREETRRERTATQNGLKVAGCLRQLEELREKVIGIIKRGAYGPAVREVVKVESSVANWPLEWAACEVNFYQPQGLDSL